MNALVSFLGLYVLILFVICLLVTDPGIITGLLQWIGRAIDYTGQGISIVGRAVGRLVEPRTPDIHDIQWVSEPARLNVRHAPRDGDDAKAVRRAADGGVANITLEVGFEAQSGAGFEANDDADEDAEVNDGESEDGEEEEEEEEEEEDEEEEEEEEKDVEANANVGIDAEADAEADTEVDSDVDTDAVEESATTEQTSAATSESARHLVWPDSPY